MTQDKDIRMQEKVKKLEELLEKQEVILPSGLYRIKNVSKSGIGYNVDFVNVDKEGKEHITSMEFNVITNYSLHFYPGTPEQVVILDTLHMRSYVENGEADNSRAEAFNIEIKAKNGKNRDYEEYIKIFFENLAKYQQNYSNRANFFLVISSKLEELEPKLDKEFEDIKKRAGNLTFEQEYEILKNLSMNLISKLDEGIKETGLIKTYSYNLNSLLL
ncbi:hypothetical protein HZA33_01085 [Candidatus Pacearchaeota archaeon]|nr:hypothetical protein [Candidatus Pacearchaeota archaeon]